MPNEPSSPTFSIIDIYNTEQKNMLDDWYINFRMDSSAGNSTSMVKLIGIEFPDVGTNDVSFVNRQCVERTDSEF